MSTEPNEPDAERTELPNRTEPNPATCSIKEAAQSLGIGERAILKRIAEGKISAYRDGREWRLYLPLEPNRTSERTSERTEPNEPPKRTERTARPPSETAPPDAVALVKQLESENAFLRSELTAQRVADEQAQAELRRLMLADRQELSRLREQLAIVAAPVEDAPQSQQEAHTDAEPPAVVIPAPLPETPRKWWQFWKP